MKSNNVGTFLSRAFHDLGKQGVVYCVLRNYEHLPEDVGNDLDLLVAPESQALFENILLKAAKQADWKLFRKRRQYQYTAYWFSHPEEEPLHIDAWTGFTWKGIPYYSVRDFLSRIQPFRSFFIPERHDHTALLLIKDLIQNGMVREKYRDELAVRLSEHGLEVAARLRPLFGKTVSTLISLAEKGKWNSVGQLAWLLRVSAARKHGLCRTLPAVIAFALRHLKNALARPSGMFVCLLGPDGSGKTTISQGVLKAGKRYFPTGVYQHGQFGIIPELKTFLQPWRSVLKSGSSAEALAMPGTPMEKGAENEGSPHGAWRTALYLLYYWFDYLLGHLVLFRVKALGQLFVCDRYFYDYFFQNRFINLPKWLFWAMNRFIPKPDLLVFLKGEPALIHARKPELSIQEITRQQTAIEDYLTYHPDHHVLDTTSSTPDETAESIIGEIARRNRWSR